MKPVDEEFIKLAIVVISVDISVVNGLSVDVKREINVGTS